MAVKVKVEDRRGSPDYPKLMKSKDSDLIVLFYQPEQGVVVQEDGWWEMGQSFPKWGTECFEDFHGSITLSND